MYKIYIDKIYIYTLYILMFLPSLSSEILLNIMCFSAKSWRRVLMGPSEMFHQLFPIKIHAEKVFKYLITL